jgi:hypothetical protein
MSQLWFGAGLRDLRAEDWLFCAWLVLMASMVIAIALLLLRDAVRRRGSGPTDGVLLPHAFSVTRLPLVIAPPPPPRTRPACREPVSEARVPLSGGERLPVREALLAMPCGVSEPEPLPRRTRTGRGAETIEGRRRLPPDIELETVCPPAACEADDDAIAAFTDGLGSHDSAAAVPGSIDGPGLAEDMAPPPALEVLDGSPEEHRRPDIDGRPDCASPASDGVHVPSPPSCDVRYAGSRRIRVTQRFWS